MPAKWAICLRCLLIFCCERAGNRLLFLFCKISDTTVVMGMVTVLPCFLVLPGVKVISLFWMWLVVSCWASVMRMLVKAQKRNVSSAFWRVPLYMLVR